MRLKSCLKLSKSAANGKAASVGGLFLGWAGDGTSMLFRVHFSPAGLPLAGQIPPLPMQTATCRRWGRYDTRRARSSELREAPAGRKPAKLSSILKLFSPRWGRAKRF